MVKVENLETKFGNPAPRQFAILTDEYIYFQSYDSVIAKYSRRNGHLWLTDKWNYSNATRLYFYQWLRYYTAYNNTKKAIESNIGCGLFEMVKEQDL